MEHLVDDGYPSGDEDASKETKTKQSYRPSLRGDYAKMLIAMWPTLTLEQRELITASLDQSLIQDDEELARNIRALTSVSSDCLDVLEGVLAALGLK